MMISKQTITPRAVDSRYVARIANRNVSMTTSSKTLQIKYLIGGTHAKE